jgi:hydroxymethylpyrimidine/phosphomethylpyrimidine kinase
VNIPRILSIAGSDSGGGAGIQADIKTITMLGGHAMTAITAVTAQNSLGVTDVVQLSPAMIAAQIDAVVNDLGVDAVKIGMVGSADAIDAILAHLPNVPIVFDPVMIATSGATLADADTIAAFGRLMRRATIVTPNVPELEALSGLGIANSGDMQNAADVLRDRMRVSVLAKGGHLPDDGEGLVYDYLAAFDHGQLLQHVWQSERIETFDSHGTGCTLSSAIAMGLAEGMTPIDAVTRAGDYVRAALTAAPGLGEGNGPMGHGLGRAHFDA